MLVVATTFAGLLLVLVLRLVRLALVLVLARPARSTCHRCSAQLDEPTSRPARSAPPRSSREVRPRQGAADYPPFSLFRLCDPPPDSPVSPVTAAARSRPHSTEIASGRNLFNKNSRDRQHATVSGPGVDIRAPRVMRSVRRSHGPTRRHRLHNGAHRSVRCVRSLLRRPPRCSCRLRRVGAAASGAAPR